MTKKIFIVDDHQIMIDGLEKIINEIDDVEIVGIACNGKEAVDKVPIIRPDLVLMDLDMPILNGLEASRILLKEVSHLKIVILTMHGERSIVERMMKLGIYGYLIKNADKEELKLGIARVLKGKKYFQTEAIEGFVRSTESKATLEMGQLSVLSDREVEILSLIAKGKTSTEISEELHISSRTVETHRKNIHQKLDIRNIAGLVRFAIQVGLVQ
ncbi:MAG: response regulator transcription factor [Cytophagales bacterium]|nr:response regulator transcription factor [Cytophagales bacterium]